jgi:hypothetical protein
MVETNPWKTPFGRLLIGSSVVAAVVGFSLALGATTYFRSLASAPIPTTDEEFALDVQHSDEPEYLEPLYSSQRDIFADPEGYAAALAGLGTPPHEGGGAGLANAADPRPIATGNLHTVDAADFPAGEWQTEGEGTD